METEKNGLKQAEAQVQVVELPEVLTRRIRSNYSAAAERIRQIEAERDSFTRTLLEGYLASVPGAEDNLYDLNADMTQLIRK